MAYKEYTSCDPPDKYLDAGFTYTVVIGGITTLVTFIFYAVTSGSIVVGLEYAAVVALIALISLLHWWLNGRLICLGGERCVIGVNMGSPSIQPRKKGGDDDASINVVLAPSPVDTNPAKKLEDAVGANPQEDYWNNPVQGAIVAPNDAVLTLGRGYAFGRHYLKAIHSEFEGSGIHDLLQWAIIVLGLLILALIAEAIPGGALIALILKILAGLITLIATAVGLFHPLDPGDPLDVNPNIGELVRGDVLVIKGRWVYDSLHEGWNEIHAIHACQRIGLMQNTTSWPADIGGGLGLDTVDRVKEALGVWCDAISKAEEAEDGGSRDDPAQNWILHPMVDGCTRTIIT